MSDILSNWEAEAKADTRICTDIYARIEFRDMRSERILTLIQLIREKDHYLQRVLKFQTDEYKAPELKIELSIEFLKEGLALTESME